MVNQKIVDWIKSEEAIGYSEQQLKNYLLKKGYAEPEVDASIIKVKVGIPYPKLLILLFILCYGFMIYSIGAALRGSIVLAVMITFYILTKHLYRIHNHITIFLVYICESAILVYILPDIGALFILLLIDSSIKYYKLKKKVYFNDIEATSFISAVLSLSAGLIVYFGIVFGLSKYFAPLSLVGMTLLISPAFLIASMCYAFFNPTILIKIFNADPIYRKRALLRGSGEFLTSTLVFFGIFLFVTLFFMTIMTPRMNSKLSFPLPNGDLMVPLNITDNNLIAQEINTEWATLVTDMPKHKIQLPDSLLEKISWANDGTYALETTDFILYLTTLGLNIVHYKTIAAAYVVEYNYLKNNYFYDNSTNIVEHIENMKRAINLLRPKAVIEVNPAALSVTGTYPEIDKLFQERTDIFSKSVFCMYKSTVLGKIIDNFQTKNEQLHKEFSRDAMDKLISEINVDESNESKALRLYVIKSSLAYFAVTNCDDTYKKMSQIGEKEDANRQRSACYKVIYSINGENICRTYTCIHILIEATGDNSLCDYLRSEQDRHVCNVNFNRNP